MKKTISAAMSLALVFAMAINCYPAERPQRVRQASEQAAQPQTPPSPAPSVLSIIPAQAEPGTRVMIFGANFGERASVFLGSIEVAARVIEGRQVEFTIPPQLDAGLYALYLKRGDGTVGRAYNFTILPLRPVLSSLTPDVVDLCAQGKGREVTAQGQNFTEQSQLYFDGAVIRSSRVSAEAISFAVPPVTGGLHQVMVKNGPDIASVPLAMTMDTRPEITQVTVGNEYVNFYEVIIEGKNFQQNSYIYVDGMRVGGRGGQETLEQREKLIFIDCTRMIYQRHPYSPVNKDFRIQVVNQAGEGSQVVNITAP